MTNILASMGASPAGFQAYTEELRATGTTLLPHGLMLNDEDIERLERLHRHLNEEHICSGDVEDDHNIFVRRVVTDWSSELPTPTKTEISREILSIIDRGLPRDTLSAVVGAEPVRYLRRCQFNRMVAGSFIGVHIDQTSNPDYTYAVSIQLAGGFNGGEFIVHAPDGPRTYAPDYGEVVITTCRYAHEVAPVIANERCALVSFYSFYGGANRRGSESSSLGPVVNAVAPARKG